MGVTGHWIDVDDGTNEWTLRSEVFAYRRVRGPHDGENLARILAGVFDRVGVFTPEKNKVRGCSPRFESRR